MNKNFFKTGFNLYGLGGTALVHTKQKANVNQSMTIGGDTITGSGSDSKTQNKVRPVLGLGASYDIPNTQLTTALEYSHIFGSGNVKTSSSAIPSADLVTFNVAYNFG